MVMHFPVPGNMVGCDFCGVIVGKGARAGHDVGTRVCGASFPYSRRVEVEEEEVEDPKPKPKPKRQSGAFASFLLTDIRLQLRVPSARGDAEGAALGQVGWVTAASALSDPDALALAGRPSAPAVDRGSRCWCTAPPRRQGTMACQLLALSGYDPIAITSTPSASLATGSGAKHTAAYTSPTCVDSVRARAGAPIRHIIDCITTADSAAICFAAMARTGGCYACLEGLPQNQRTCRVIRVGPKDGPYSREANPALFAICCRWAVERQELLDAGGLKHHPVRQPDGRWGGIIEGLGMLKRDQVRGHKLVVRIADAEGPSDPVG